MSFAYMHCKVSFVCKNKEILYNKTVSADSSKSNNVLVFQHSPIRWDSDRSAVQSEGIVLFPDVAVIATVPKIHWVDPMITIENNLLAYE